MPRISRDLSGSDLCRALERLGQQVIRRRGSHIRLEASHRSGLHRLAIPDDDTIKIGTLNHIHSDVADAIAIAQAELVTRLFEK